MAVWGLAALARMVVLVEQGDPWVISLRPINYLVISTTTISLVVPNTDPTEVLIPVHDGQAAASRTREPGPWRCVTDHGAARNDRSSRAPSTRK